MGGACLMVTAKKARGHIASKSRARQLRSCTKPGRCHLLERDGANWLIPLSRTTSLALELSRDEERARRGNSTVHNSHNPLPAHSTMSRVPSQVKDGSSLA